MDLANLVKVSLEQDVQQQVVLHTDFRKSTVLAPIQIKVDKTFRLKEVVRDAKRPEIYEEKDIFSIFDPNAGEMSSLSKFKSFDLGPDLVANLNNKASFNERKDMHPKLAICICAYNEDRKMLQQSLKGIYDSLDEFKDKVGISQDEIVVVIIFDGVENVKTGDYSESMLTFFDEIDYTNGFILREGEHSYQEHLFKEANDIDWNTTSAFSLGEIERNTKRRFRMKYEEYMRCKELQKECLKKNKTIDIENLMPEVLEKYKELREDYLRGQVIMSLGVGISDEKIQIYTKNALVFDSSYSTRRVFVEEAYNKVLEYCKEYFESRQDTTLVYPMEFQPDTIRNQTSNNIQKFQLNVLMCVKHRNAGKLSSHALFFLGFCEFMKPELCLLLDVGLRPLDDAIYRMFEYMDKHPSIGGACGYMGLRLERNGDDFGISADLEHLDPVSSYIHQNIFSIQRAQMFEYHLGHLIDKPFEACFNFIHVLPGAFSCYRYRCLDRFSLQEYLKTVLFPNEQRTLEEQNRFLAEDRTLSLILKDKQCDFAYIPTAKAVVDPASNLVSMMGQRRRWINGSWFAFFDVFSQREKVKDCLTLIQFYYYYLLHGIVYISMSLFFVSMAMMVRSTMQLILDQIIRSGTSMPLATYNSVRDIVTHVICFIYVFMLGGVVFLGLQVKNTDKKFQRVYFFTSTFLGLYGIMVLVLTAYNLFITFRDGIDAPVFGAGTNIVPPIYSRVLMAGTVAIYALHVIFAFSPRVWCEVLVSTPSAVFYSPTYLHLLMIYAFCKIDDFSWGTKGLDKESVAQKHKQNANRLKKYNHINKYIGTNVFVSLVLTILISYDEPKQIFIAALAGLLFLIAAFKFLMSTIYLIKYQCMRFGTGYSSSDIADNVARGQIIKDQLTIRIDKIKETARERSMQNIIVALGLVKGMYTFSSMQVK